MECVFKAREQIEAIWGAIEHCSVGGGAHEKFISAMLFVSFNHCDGIQTLVQNKNFSSAYALIRPLLETSFRAIWLHRCANEQQIQECMENDQWKSAWVMVQEIETYNSNTPILSNIWSEMRPLMHSYTHGGVHNALRQLGDGNSVTPNIPDIEVFQLMQTVGLMSWLLLAEIIDLSKNKEQLKLFEELGKGLNQWAFNKSIQTTANASAD